MRNQIEYKHRISKLKNLNQRLEEMGISVLDDNTVMWVYLQSFPDDDILTGQYIYNFGIMDEEMKQHIGDVIDYGCYLQTIVEMKFSDFKDFYQTQAEERNLLFLRHPGLIMKIENPEHVKKKRKSATKTLEEQENQKEKLKKYQKEYYERVTKIKREKERKEKHKIKNQ